MIDRYLLRYLLAVADHGSFSRAAAHCGVSQPTLSVGIAKLEGLLGAPMFERSNRRVELTPAGVRVVAHARRIEGEFGDMERVVRDDPPAMLVRIGLVATLPSRWIESALVAAHAAGCGERIELVEGRVADLLPKLERARIDALLGPAPDDCWRPLFTEGYAMALPVGHHLAGRATVGADEVAGEAMIVRRQCEALPAVSRFFTARGVRPFMAARVADDDRALAYVRAGLGITVMPRCYAGGGIAMPLLAGFDAMRTIGFRAEPDGRHRLERSAAFAAFAASIAASHRAGG